MREKKKPRRKQSTNHPWHDHPLYGRIPLLRHTTHVNGKTYERWQYDPAFKPEQPSGAVEGDVTQQVFYDWHVPKYFYVDETSRCIQCEQPFTFTAREQKFWYETRKFNFRSVPVRCAACRRKRRSEHALRNQLAVARREVDAAPDDPAAHLALARAIVELHERTNTGRLDHAIAAARKAAKRWPEAREPALWEGVAQLRAGRARLGRACLETLLARHGRIEAGLETKAQRYLDGRAH